MRNNHRNIPFFEHAKNLAYYSGEVQLISWMNLKNSALIEME